MMRPESRSAATPWIVLTLIAFATLTFGAVYPWAYWPLFVAAAVIGAIGIGQYGIVPELRNHATDLTSKGAHALIVDLRRTAEGPYDNGIEAARLFVKSGTLAIRAGREKEGPRQPITTKSGDGAVEVPVTMLVTTGTSGPAELFVAALDGNNRADVIGERTIGRAGLQKLVKLPEGRGLWLTYARYLKPDGGQIQGHGIEPDVEIDEPNIEFGAPAPEKDVILDAALARIQKR